MFVLFCLFLLLLLLLFFVVFFCTPPDDICTRPLISNLILAVVRERQVKGSEIGCDGEEDKGEGGGRLQKGKQNYRNKIR